jgi:hypothetical protein
MASLISRLGSVSRLASLAAALLLTAGCAGQDGATASNDENEADFAQELKSKTDAQVQAEIEAAAVGANYTSESDYGFTFVSAKLEGETSMTQALVRTKLGSFVDADPATDKPLAPERQPRRRSHHRHLDVTRGHCSTAGTMGSARRR